MLQIDIITLFPEMVTAMLGDSIIARAQEEGKVKIEAHNLRKWTKDTRKTVDDHPFGGGPGMLMMVEPIYLALKDLGVKRGGSGTKIVLTSARGNTWKQTTAHAWSTDLTRLVIICGHYEGVDQRVSDHLIDEEVSIGNYVLTGGELAAGVLVDSITRLLPGVLGNEASLVEESHNEAGESEYPQYTRPATFTTEEGETWETPAILLSGNHAAIKKWQEENKKG